jgi:site-specific DNA-methyltransferase (adenine-specific)
MNTIKPFINRVTCGDAVQIVKQLPSNSVDLVITDPPYGDNCGYGMYNRKIVGNEHPLLGLLVMAESYRVLKKHSTAYMFFGMKHLGFIQSFFTSYTSYKIREIVVWDKVAMGLGYAFRKQHEGILVLEKGKPQYRNHSMLNVISIRKVPTPHHPHTKPVALIKELILHSSDKGDIVLDPFVGSGSTVIAAKELRRQYIGIEVDKRYWMMAQQRLQHYYLH